MGIYIKGMGMPMDGRILIVFPSGRVLEVSADATQDIFRETQAIPVQPHGDLIDRNETIKALWKSLYEYEDKTEKHFVESSELDVADWMLHRIFVQNMSDIDRQTILQMPTVIPASEDGE